MTTVLRNARKRTIALAQAPVGLFYYGDTLALKTEYGSNEGRIDAYIVSSGEFFWGAAPQTIASQRATMVMPVIVEEQAADDEVEGQVRSP